MCCIQCSHFGLCHSAITLRQHKGRVADLPAVHYNLCRTTAPCNMRCHSCSRLVRRVGSLPQAKFSYGCCSRCQYYSTCSDFVRQNVKQAMLLGAYEKAGSVADSHPVTKRSS